MSPRLARLSVLFLLTFSFHLLHGQEMSALFESYNAQFHTEKVYIHTDNDYYFPESTIYGKVYLVHASDHILIDTTVLIHVDLISPTGETINQILLRADAGVADFTMNSDLSFESGKYVVRGYTQYQRNFDDSFIFQKEIQFVQSPDDVKIDLLPSDSLIVDFFPEGGHLVTGLMSTLAFKVTDNYGKPLELSGHIEDDKGEVVGTLNHVIEGLGKGRFLVQSNMDYFGVFNYNGNDYKFKLPRAIDKGYSFQISSKSSEIIIDCRPNPSMQNHTVEILGHIRGQVFLSKTMNGNAPVRYRLDKNTIPSGILHFTLFDEQNRPIAERLAYNENPNEDVSIEIQVEEDVLFKRSKVNGSVSLSDAHGQASMTVYSSDVLSEQLDGIDIRTYLLFQSDLKGKISNLSHFFNSAKLEYQSTLDLLLMTHGWRKFKWLDVVEQRLPEIAYPPETSSTLAGQVTMKHNDKPVAADVAVTLMSDSLFANLMYTTGEDGVFYFTGIDLSDTTDVVIQAAKHKAKKKKKKKEEAKISGNRYVKINLLNWDDLEFDKDHNIPISIIQTGHNEDEAPGVIREDGEELRASNQSSIFDGALWSIDLQEVVVSTSVSRGQKRNLEAKRRYEEKDMFFFASTDKFNPDEPQFDQFNWKNVYQMIKTVVPQAYIIQEDGIQKIVHRGGGPATIVIDGVVQPDDREVLLDPDHVAMIDVLLDPRAPALYGVGAAIVLITKSDAEKSVAKKDGVLAMSLPGYHEARAFYSPDYSTFTSSDPDFRTTLQWEPHLILDGDPYDFEFYSGDLLGDFIISIEGITNDGVPFVDSKTIRVAN